MKALAAGTAALAVTLGLTAGCGGTVARQPSTQARETVTCRHRGPLTPRQQHWLARVRVDLAAMRQAKTHARASQLTDRFLLDLGRGNLPIYTANRLIDHAVYSVTAICQDCFQALEAERPIAVPQRCS